MLYNSSPTKFARYPLLVLALCFGTGVALERSVSIPLAATACILAAACLISYVFPRLSAAALSIAFVILGALCLQLSEAGVSADRLRKIYDSGQVSSGTEIRLEGVVANGPEPTVDGIVMTLDVGAIEYSGIPISASGAARVYVLASTDADKQQLATANLGYGLRLRATCPLRREENFQNPGVFSQIEMLDQQGIDALCTVKDPSAIEVVGQDRRSIPRAIFDQRRKIIESFRTLLDAPTAGVMIASLLGDRYFVDRDTADVFRDGGTFHILVISGLHITFIGAAVLLAAGLLTRRRITRFVLAAAILWAYTLAVGAEVPVVRASLMFTVLLISQLVRRDGTLLNSFGLCGLLLLVWRPADLFTASFQLTFVSVGAIVGIALPLIEKLRAIGEWSPTSSTPFPPNVPFWLRRSCELLYWRADAWQAASKRNIWTARIFKSPASERFKSEAARWLARYIFEGLLLSAIVQICLLPLSIYYFHRVSFASIFLNLWVGVVLAIESFFALSAVAISVFNDTLAAPFAATAELCNVLLTSVPAAMADLVPLSFRVPIYSEGMRAIYPAFLVLIGIVAIILFRWAPFRLKHPAPAKLLLVGSLVPACLVGAMILLHPFSGPRPNDRLTIDFLDVGQGDAAFITFPDGKTMLIDGGGRFSYGREGDFVPDLPRIGERVVSEFLWDRGLSKIDYVLATHADADHMQGLSDVVRNFDVGEVLISRAEPGDPEFAELQDRIARIAIPLSIVGVGDTLTIAGATVKVLHPEFDDSPNTVSDNNSSLVVRIIFGSRAFLFAGDIEQSGEASAIQHAADIRSDVVKVPHHGSKTSSTQQFVDAVHPEFAVISVGRRSTFGHPNDKVVERWKKAGASVLTTGENGTITVSTDGDDLRLSTYLKKTER